MYYGAMIAKIVQQNAQGDEQPHYMNFEPRESETNICTTIIRPAMAEMVQRIPPGIA